MRFRITTALVLLSLVGQLAVAQAGQAHDIVYIRQPHAFVIESTGSGTVDIVRGTHGSGPATVRAATVGGTATPGEDYTPADEVLRFPEPIGEHELTFPIVDDSIVEPLETVDVTLSEPTGGVTIAGTGRGSRTIIDNDGPARISFSAAAVTTFENFGQVELAIVRSGSVQNIGAISSVGYSTSDGTATAGADFQQTSGTITFESGQRIKRITVPLVNDGTREDTETFSVALTDITGAETAEPATAEVTVHDDENPASDTTPPVTYFHQPLHGRTYRPGVIRDFLLQTEDIGSGIKNVHLALRAKMSNGRCRWYRHREKGFVRGACSKKVWGIRLPGSQTVYYTFPRKLRSSRGTNIRYYTAWSRGIDQVGNVERSFETNRNQSRFEVR